MIGTLQADDARTASTFTLEAHAVAISASAREAATARANVVGDAVPVAVVVLGDGHARAVKRATALAIQGRAVLLARVVDPVTGDRHCVGGARVGARLREWDA